MYRWSQQSIPIIKRVKVEGSKRFRVGNDKIKKQQILKSSESIQRVSTKRNCGMIA